MRIGRIDKRLEVFKVVMKHSRKTVLNKIARIRKIINKEAIVLIF